MHGDPEHDRAYPAGLTPAQLRRRIDPATLGFETTETLEVVQGLIGQDRAMQAIRLAARIGHRSFNLFVVGPPGTGRHSAVQMVLAREAADRPVPCDWAYVNNFEDEQKPRALKLPSGEAQRLKAEMEDLVDDLGAEIPALFEADDYQARRKALEAEFAEAGSARMQEFAARAKAEDVGIVNTPSGFLVAAIRDGEVIEKEAFDKLSPDEQARIEEKIARFQKELNTIIEGAPALVRAHRQQVIALHASMAEQAVQARINEARASFAGIDSVQHYLDEVAQDMIRNAELFLEAHAQGRDGPFPAGIRKIHRLPQFGRYVINVMVSHPEGGTAGAPLETEELPTLNRLVGRIENIAHMGALMTNFTLIRPGALHRANGGFLVLDARRVLAEPFAWEALKRSLQHRTIAITSMAERLSLVQTLSLEPDPIPLDLRVVLVGDRMLYALLVMLDPDFSELFKLQADFEEDFALTPENTALFARLLASFIRREGLRPLTAAAVARLLEEALRRAEDSEKLSLHLGALADILREAEHYACTRQDCADAAAPVSVDDIELALAEAERRSARIRDRMQEAITRGTILIDTDGAVTGQINGLSVAQIGDFRFGRPTRITARVRMGAGKLVDIEREVELGGPLHSKGVLILSGYLSANYALDMPFSLQASLVFEQSYGGVDGDSASSTELYALLSALSDLPIRQGLAVTGSVNQAGQVQAIGGVNEKIEGFFDICAARGLTGAQGVLIPASNVPHLMLRADVVAAVEAGQFHVLPVSTIDEGIAILTGVDAGVRGADGAYPEGSVNARVEARLASFALARQQFGRSLGGKPEGGGEESGPA